MNTRNKNRTELAKSNRQSGWLIRGGFSHQHYRVGLACLVVAMVMGTRPARGQFEHSDILFRYEKSRVVTDKDSYTATFPRTGISRQYSSNPGISSERDLGGGVPAGDQIAYDVMGGLRYWSNGAIREPLPGTSIRIENNPPSVPETSIRWHSEPQAGQFEPPRNRIGQASAAGEVHSHVSFFLDPLEATEEWSLPAMGAYGLQLRLRTSAMGVEPSSPFLVVFNHGLNSASFQQAVDAFRKATWTGGLAGDFDGNGVLDAVDIDRLTAAILAGDSSPAWDLDANGSVAAGDRQYWVESLKRTYFGDANLDGRFDTGDLVAVFQRGQYEDSTVGNSWWSDGDWNGDREFNSADFIVAFQGGGFEQGPRSAVASAVPEPACATMVLSACFMVQGLRRWNRVRAGSRGGSAPERSSSTAWTPSSRRPPARRMCLSATAAST